MLLPESRICVVGVVPLTRNIALVPNARTLVPGQFTTLTSKTFTPQSLTERLLGIRGEENQNNSDRPPYEHRLSRNYMEHELGERLLTDQALVTRTHPDQPNEWIERTYLTIPRQGIIYQRVDQTTPELTMPGKPVAFMSTPILKLYYTSGAPLLGESCAEE
jgi:hypothetical protein